MSFASAFLVLLQPPVPHGNTHRGSTRACLAGFAAVLAASLPLTAQAFSGDVPIGCTPLDAALSADGTRAVVRAIGLGGAVDGLTVWDTSGVGTVTAVPVLPAPGSSWNLGTTPRLSDCVATAGRIAVVVGSATNTTTTSVLGIGNGGPATILATFVTGSGTMDPGRAGMVHDLAVTPDGSKAVVHGRNWVDVIDIGNLTCTSINLPTAFGSPLPRATPEFGYTLQATGEEIIRSPVDSVEVTNDRALVITNLFVSPPPTNYVVHAYAFVIDLTTATVLNRIQLQAGDSYNVCHDLAVFPAKNIGVVTSDAGDSFIDLATGTLLAEVGDAIAVRDYGGNQRFGAMADSVVTAGERVFTITNDFVAPTVLRGRCRSYLLTSPTPFTPELTVATDPFVGGPFRQVHDLAATPSGKTCVVRFEDRLVAVSPGSPTPVVSIAAPWLYINYNAFGRLSDSVVATDTWAASISRQPSGSLAGQLLHLQLGPMLLTQVALTGGAPFDIAATTQRIILRCQANTSPFTNGIAVFDGPTGSSLANFASQGQQSYTPAFAIDAVETNTRKAFAVSAGGAGGFVQLVNY